MRELRIPSYPPETNPICILVLCSSVLPFSPLPFLAADAWPSEIVIVWLVKYDCNTKLWSYNFYFIFCFTPANMFIMSARFFQAKSTYLFTSIFVFVLSMSYLYICLMSNGMIRSQNKILKSSHFFILFFFLFLMIM